jgi:hypothetical protein
MKRIIPVLLLAFALSACQDGGPTVPADGPEFAKGGPPPNAHWLSDYFPLNPHRFGIRIYYSYDEEDYFVAAVTGTETVPYTSGAIEATTVFVEDEEIGMYVDGREMWWGVIEGDYYLSEDCDLTALPTDGGVGKVWDGLYLDATGMEASLVKKDGSECIPLPGNDRLTLFKIDDIDIFGQKHANALVVWSLEPEEYQPLDFEGYEDEWGITLPTSSETHGNAVDGFVIFAFNDGLVVLGETSVDDGDLDELEVLVAKVPTPTVPVRWVSGGGSVVREDIEGSPRETYGFAAQISVDGSVKGQAEIHFPSSGLNMHIDIQCLVVEGNEAWLSGPVTRSDRPDVDPGTVFVWRVQDNGQGQDAPPDRVSNFFYRPWDNYPPDRCQRQTDFPTFPWDNGSVRIH